MIVMNINLPMWGKALRVIPRVSKEQWQKLDPIARWLIASRSAVFIMTAFSVIIGGLLAVRSGHFDWPIFALCFFGLIFAHGTNNLLNDYVDYTRGVDKDNYYRTKYGPQPLQAGLWSAKHHLAVTGITGLLAAACGFGIIAITADPTIIWLTLAGAFFVLFYTWPLKYFGLGEPAVVLTWGPLIIGGTYTALTGEWSWPVAAIGAVYALGPTTVLFGKHTDKLQEDKPKKIHTLPVILGESLARKTIIALLWLIPILSVVLVVAGYVGPALLLVVLSIPKILEATRAFAKPRPTKEPKSFPEGVWPLYFSAMAFNTNKTTGSLFALGILIDTVLTRVF